MSLYGIQSVNSPKGWLLYAATVSVDTTIAAWYMQAYDPSGALATLTLPPGASLAAGTLCGAVNVTTSADPCFIDGSGTDTVLGIAAPGAYTLVGGNVSAIFMWDGVSNWVVI